jgi:prolipoprotein diacylglyceryltransferase
MKQLLKQEIFPYIFSFFMFYLALQIYGIILLIGIIMSIEAIKSIYSLKYEKYGFKIYRGF